MINPIERRHDTLPISKTFYSRLLLPENAIRLRVKRFKCCGQFTDKVGCTCWLRSPMKAER